MKLRTPKKPALKKTFEDVNSDNNTSLMRRLELDELRKIWARSKTIKPPKLKPLPPLPEKVDYAPQIPFVRHQGAWGCGMFARVACWDIMNELACPYSPNLSVNRHLWAFIKQVITKELIPGLKQGVTYETSDQYMINVGCPTEGSEFTDTDAVRWPTYLGDIEASNFRIQGKKGVCSPQVAAIEEVSVDINTLRFHLTKHPLRVVVNQGTHFVALIGYDDSTKKFKFINSAGDNNSGNGYYYVDYANLNNEVQAADYCEFEPPKPMPVARISLKSAYRQDVYLWLSNENTTWTKRVWPNGQRQDDSRSLTITVPLPFNFQWPPTSSFPLKLEVFCTTEHYNAGGDILEFTAANAGTIIPCKKLKKGAVHFDPYKVTKLTIP